MKFWAAIGILVAAAALGAIVYVAVDRYVYANGISINLKLVAVSGAIVAIASLVVLAFLRKRAS